MKRVADRMPVLCSAALLPHPAQSRRSVSRVRTLGGALCLSLPLTLLPGVVAAAGSEAQAAGDASEEGAARRRFSIPPGELEATLNRFGRDAGIPLSFASDLTAGLRSPGVDGVYSVQAALAHLLEGTGLVAVAQSGGGWALVRSAQPATRAPAAGAAVAGGAVATLPSVRVNAAPETGTGPVVGYTARRTATATRTDVELLNTPVSVQTVTRDVMDDQKSVRLTDALANVSGVYANHGPDGNTMDAFVIRGFEVAAYGASYLDGVKDFGRAPKDMAGLERVEVLKGPAAIMYGRIEPGGMINRVSKRPQAEGFTRLSQEIGSHRYFRTTLDSTGALDADGRWLYRVNVAGVDAEGFKVDTMSRRLYIAPQIEWRPSAATAVRVGYEYLKDKRSWALGYGTIGNDAGPVNIPVRTNLHGRDEYYKEESNTFRLEWSHQFSEGWEVRQRASYGQRRSVSEGSWLDSADAAGNYERTFWGWGGEKSRVVSTNLELLGRFTTGPVRHTFIAGGDFYHEAYDSGGWGSDGTPVVSNIYAPNPDNSYRADRVYAPYDYDNRNRGLFVQDQASLFDDRLHLLAGVRYDKARYHQRFDANAMTANDQKATWRAGVLYKLRPDLSVYASYVTGFGASQFDWSSGGSYPPQTSKQMEFGVKYQLDRRLNLTVAYFDLVKDNLTMTDPANPLRTILAGEARSRGVEVDVSGRIGANLDVIASYAYTDVRYTRSDSLQGERVMGVPRHGASLWGTYRFGASGWRGGAGVVHRSAMLGTQYGWSPQLYPYMLQGYTLLNAMISYDFRVGRYSARAQINGNNLTNRRYNPTTYGGTSRIGLGEPRSVVASISVTF